MAVTVGLCKINIFLIVKITVDIIKMLVIFFMY